MSGKVYLEVVNGISEGACTTMEKDAFVIGDSAETDFRIGSGIEGMAIRFERQGDENTRQLVVTGLEGDGFALNDQVLVVGAAVGDGDLLEMRKTKVFIGLGRDSADPAALKRLALRRT